AAKAGTLEAGLSELVLRAATRSKITLAGMSTLELLSLLREDLAAPKAVLDGLDGGGAPLLLGTCDSVCVLSSKTLREDLAASIAGFLGSTTNLSGLGVGDAKDLMDGLACGPAGVLFPTHGSCDYDHEGPEITIDGASDGTILAGDAPVT